MNLEFVAMRFSQITKRILIAASGRIETRCRWVNHWTPATLASAIACWANVTDSSRFAGNLMFASAIRNIATKRHKRHKR